MFKVGLNIFGSWVLINLVLAMVIPILFFILSGIIVNNPNLWDLRYIWEMLMDKGVFMFLGLTFLLSVFQDYKNAKKAFNWLAWFMLFVVILFTGFLFISSMGVIPEGKTFEQNKFFYYWVFIGSIVCSMALKTKAIILILNNNKINRYGL